MKYNEQDFSDAIGAILGILAVDYNRYEDFKTDKKVLAGLEVFKMPVQVLDILQGSLISIRDKMLKMPIVDDFVQTQIKNIKKQGDQNEK